MIRRISENLIITISIYSSVNDRFTITESHEKEEVRLQKRN